MKNTILIIIVILLTGACKGQTRVSELTSKISLCFNTYSLGSKKQIHLNSRELILDIDNCQIPLEIVSIKYESDPRTVNGLKREGLLFFNCQSDCIFNEGETILSMGYAFKSKKGAYNAIELINELIRELEK